MALVKDYQNNEPNKTYLEKVALVESGGNPNAKAKTSSAVGQFQFVEGTWKDIVKRYKLGYTLEDRKDPVKSAKVMELYTQENEKALKPVLGRNLTDSEKYLGHFLGVAGAKSVFLASKKDPNMPVNYYISPKSLEANKSVFYNKDGSVKTTSQLLNWADDKMGVSVNWENSVKPYMNVTSDVTNLQVPAQNTTFVPVPDVYKEKTAEKETETEQAKQQIAQSQNEEDFIQAYKRKEQPQEQEVIDQPINVLNTFAQVSSFIDNPVAQEGRRVLDWEYLKNKPGYNVKDERVGAIKQIDKTSTPSKSKVTDLKKVNVRNKTPEEIIAERKAAIKKGDEAVLNQGLNVLKPELWTRENWSDAASGIGEKLRFFSNDTDSFVDEYLNPFKMVGDMAQSLGQAPLTAEKTDSYLPYVTAIGAPLTVGAIGGIGTKTTGQFVNNLVSPVNINKNTLKSFKNQLSLAKDLIFDKNTKFSGTFLFDSKSKIYKDIEEGFSTLDNSIEQKIKELNTEEGYSRLVNQEKEYLQNLYKDVPYTNDVFLTRQAEINAKNRIEELENIKVFGNKNKEFIYNVDKNKVAKIGIIKPDIETAMYKFDIPNNNAHYDLDSKVFDPAGSDMIPGKIVLGRGFTESTPTAFHEIAHALQRGRKLNIDDELRGITPDYKSNLSYDDINSYTYFKEGSDGQEPSAFLAELREKMKKDGFIKNTYDKVTPEIIEKAKEFYTKNKNKKVLIQGNGNLLSTTDTRILDFARPTQENYKIISDALNKLPAIVPIAVGAGALSQESRQQGGIVQDNDGYLNPKNWGKTIEISSPSITMRGVKEPLIGYSPDTGETKLMQPGQDYFFNGAKKVIETPLTKAEKEFLKELQDAKNR